MTDDVAVKLAEALKLVATRGHESDKLILSLCETMVKKIITLEENVIGLKNEVMSLRSKVEILRGVMDTSFKLH